MQKTTTESRFPIAILVAVSALSVGLMIYIGLFLSARIWSKTTNEGPGETFDAVFAPLSAVAVEKPDYWNDVLGNGGHLDVFVEQVNEGNGYVYFLYKTQKYRAYYGASLSSEHSQRYQGLQFSADVVTDDAFEPRFMVTADLSRRSEQDDADQAAAASGSK